MTDFEKYLEGRGYGQSLLAVNSIGIYKDASVMGMYLVWQAAVDSTKGPAPIRVKIVKTTGDEWYDVGDEWEVHPTPITELDGIKLECPMYLVVDHTDICISVAQCEIVTVLTYAQQVEKVEAWMGALGTAVRQQLRGLESVIQKYKEDQP